MHTIKKECLNCSKEFEARLADHNRGRAVYCSISCSSKHTNTLRPPKESNCRCATCLKLFHRSSSKQKNSKSGLQFCSRVCKEMGQKIGGFPQLQLPHYKNGDHADYRFKAMKHLPNKCNRCSYSRCLSCLEVHHKDRDRLNNDLANLEILCRNCHGEEHHL